MADLLRPSTSEALRRLLRQSKTETEQRGRPAPQHRYSLVVRCTDGTAAAATGIGAECYPAIVVDLDSTELVEDQADLGEVWLTVVQDGVAVEPVQGGIYIGLLYGEHTEGTDTRPRVFAVQTEGGTVVDVTTRVCPEIASWRTVTATTDTMTQADDAIILDTTSNNIAVTLPAWRAGDYYLFKRISGGGNTVTAAAPSSGSIDGTVGALAITPAQWDSKWIYASGTSNVWYRVG